MNNQEEYERRELGSFFSDLREQLEIVANCEARIARFEAPRFNLFNPSTLQPFNPTYIGSLENKITESLKDLLDPEASHGQGRSS
jgi:hypothetical protein